MKRKLHKIAKDTNSFLKKYLKLQKKTDLLKAMSYGLLPGGKKIRSKILVDVGKIFNINYNVLIQIGAAVECIHAYSLIHDDLPCMDNDNLRRGRLSTHKKFGEFTAILAGNSLLTLALEILTDNNLKINNKSKVYLASFISKSSGHEGIAGGQYYDLSFEKKKISLTKILNMQKNKTGKLFGFCCVAPLLILSKKKELSKFNKIGEDIGLLFQTADDLIDFRGDKKLAGKKTRKDLTKGKATLISLLGYKNTIKYAEKLKLNIFNKIRIYGNKSSDLKETIEFILNRNR
jgi:geranylgeranyl pyrophosphate synthase